MNLLSKVVYVCTVILLANLFYLFWLNKKKKIDTTDFIIPFNSLFIILMSNFAVWFDASYISHGGFTGNAKIFAFNLINVFIFLGIFFFFLNMRSENKELRKNMDKKDIKKEEKIKSENRQKENAIKKRLRENKKDEVKINKNVDKVEEVTEENIIDVDFEEIEIEKEDKN